MEKRQIIVNNKPVDGKLVMKFISNFYSSEWINFLISKDIISKNSTSKKKSATSVIPATSTTSSILATEKDNSQVLTIEQCLYILKTYFPIATSNQNIIINMANKMKIDSSIIGIEVLPYKISNVERFYFLQLIKNNYSENLDKFIILMIERYYQNGVSNIGRKLLPSILKRLLPRCSLKMIEYLKIFLKKIESEITLRISNSHLLFNDNIEIFRYIAYGSGKMSNGKVLYDKNFGYRRNITFDDILIIIYNMNTLYQMKRKNNFEVMLDFLFECFVKDSNIEKKILNIEKISTKNKDLLNILVKVVSSCGCPRHIDFLYHKVPFSKFVSLNSKNLLHVAKIYTTKLKRYLFTNEGILAYSPLELEFEELNELFLFVQMEITPKESISDGTSVNLSTRSKDKSGRSIEKSIDKSYSSAERLIDKSTEKSVRSIERSHGSHGSDERLINKSHGSTERSHGSYDSIDKSDDMSFNDSDIEELSSIEEESFSEIYSGSLEEKKIISSTECSEHSEDLEDKCIFPISSSPPEKSQDDKIQDKRIFSHERIFDFILENKCYNVDSDINDDNDELTPEQKIEEYITYAKSNKRTIFDFLYPNITDEERINKMINLTEEVVQKYFSNEDKFVNYFIDLLNKHAYENKYMEYIFTRVVFHFKKTTKQDIDILLQNFSDKIKRQILKFFVFKDGKVSYFYYLELIKFLCTETNYYKLETTSKGVDKSADKSEKLSKSADKSAKSADVEVRKRSSDSKVDEKLKVKKKSDDKVSRSKITQDKTYSAINDFFMKIDPSCSTDSVDKIKSKDDKVRKSMSQESFEETNNKDNNVRDRRSSIVLPPKKSSGKKLSKKVKEVSKSENHLSFKQNVNELITELYQRYFSYNFIPDFYINISNISESNKYPNISELRKPPDISESSKNPNISESSKYPNISESDKPKMEKHSSNNNVQLSLTNILFHTSNINQQCYKQNINKFLQSYSHTILTTVTKHGNLLLYLHFTSQIKPSKQFNKSNYIFSNKCIDMMKQYLNDIKITDKKKKEIEDVLAEYLDIIKYEFREKKTDILHAIRNQMYREKIVPRKIINNKFSGSKSFGGIVSSSIVSSSIVPDSIVSRGKELIKDVSQYIFHNVPRKINYPIIKYLLSEYDMKFEEYDVFNLLYEGDFELFRLFIEHLDKIDTSESDKNSFDVLLRVSFRLRNTKFIIYLKEKHEQDFKINMSNEYIYYICDINLIREFHLKNYITIDDMFICQYLSQMQKRVLHCDYYYTGAKQKDVIKFLEFIFLSYCPGVYVNMVKTFLSSITDFTCDKVIDYLRLVSQ